MLLVTLCVYVCVLRRLGWLWCLAPVMVPTWHASKNVWEFLLRAAVGEATMLFFILLNLFAFWIAITILVSQLLLVSQNLTQNEAINSGRCVRVCMCVWSATGSPPARPV